MRSSVLLRPPPAWTTGFAVALAAYGLLVGFAGSFTGLGGGFILVPFLLLLRLPLYQAVGTSFVAVLAISLTALTKHAAHGMIVLEVGLALGLGGIVGSQIGARLVKRVSRRRFHRIFSVLLLGLAGYLGTDAFLQATGGEPLNPAAPAATATSAESTQQARVLDGDDTEVPTIEPAPDDVTVATEAPLSPISVNAVVFAVLAVVGLLVGIAAAFAGMGGGFLLVPILLVLDFGVVVAVATAFVAILMIAVSSLYAHIRLKGVLWRHGLVLAGAGVIGAYIGAAVLHDVPAALFKAIFAALLAVFGMRMAWEGWRPSRQRSGEAGASEDEEASDLNETFAPVSATSAQAVDDEAEEDAVSGNAPDNP